MLARLALIAFIPALVFAAQAPQFAKPASAPDEVSVNYVGKSNGTLPKTRVVSGKVFDRLTQVAFFSVSYVRLGHFSQTGCDLL